MKKILLSIALFLGLNQSIQSSYALGALSFAKSAFGSIKSTITAGKLMLYGVIPSVGSYFAYKMGNEGVEQKINMILPALEAITKKESDLHDNLNMILPALEAMTKKEPNFYDDWGTAGKVLGGVLMAYGFLKFGISEIAQFNSILGIINRLKGGGQDSESEGTGARLQQQPQGLGQKLKPAQRAYRAQKA
jgi:hypothetical protein